MDRNGSSGADGLTRSRRLGGAQELLASKGFNPGEEDMLFWQFGDTTDNSLKYFQVQCSAEQCSAVKGMQCRAVR